MYTHYAYHIYHICYYHGKMSDWYLKTKQFIDHGRRVLNKLRHNHIVRITKYVVCKADICSVYFFRLLQRANSILDTDIFALELLSFDFDEGSILIDGNHVVNR